MIKLKESGAIISLENVRLVKKVSNLAKGESYHKRWIEITYSDGNTIQVGYGYDDHYYSDSNPKLNVDYKQIEDELLA